jgi:hypothetical protein
LLVGAEGGGGGGVVVGFMPILSNSSVVRCRRSSATSAMAATVGGKELKSIIRFVVAQWCEFVELSGTLFLSRFQIKQQKLTWMSPNMANGGKRSRNEHLWTPK